MAVNDLWGQVFRGPTEGVREVGGGDTFLGEPKVGQADVPVFVQKNILWLQVPVDYCVFVQALESQRDLGRVELGPGLVEAAAPLQCSKQ